MKKILFISLMAASLSASCAKDAPTPGGNSGLTPNPTPSMTIHALPDGRGSSEQLIRAEGVGLEIITPRNQHGFLQFTPDFPRNVPSKVVPVAEFTRTLEKTDLRLRITLTNPGAHGTKWRFSLYRGGRLQGDAELDAGTKHGATQAELSFTTPKLNEEQRQSGFAPVSYDLFVEKGNERSHLPFGFLLYDEGRPSLVEPDKSGECLVYHTPERASGCYQNRTRTTQTVVFNDSVVRHNEVDVQLSGGLGIAASIVSLQLGGSVTKIKSTDVSRGSEIDFTNCIECASVIYRQQVESIRRGNVYQVMADGSATWMGMATLRSSQVAYEFASTGSESRNYNCDIPSQLPTGVTGECTK